jgi:type IV pilus assembly protein PilB
MEKRSKPIGEILSALGRITAADVERALAHQRERGGFFGDALVELGILSADEVKFALADQYDIPFVHLRPESIDRAVAQMVPAEWAREHQLLPVLRDGNVVTVILTVPPTAEELEAVRRFTRAARVEAAVSTGETIEALIDAVHGESDAATVPLGEWLTRAIDVGSREIGLSVRAQRVGGWYRADGEGVVRATISAGWKIELERVLSPFVKSGTGSVRSWPAMLAANGRLWRSECSAIETLDAAEYVFRLDTALPDEPLEAGAARELRQTVASLRRRGAVTLRAVSPEGAVPPGVLETALPGLPAALLGAGVRSLHLADRAVAIPPGVLSLQPAGSLAAALAALEAFAFDALVLDVERLEAADLEAACHAAPLVVFRDLDHLSRRLRADLDVCLRHEQTLLWSPVS